MNNCFYGEDGVSTLSLKAREDYVDTPSIHVLADRARAYINTGFPLHLRGPAGCGKTTLAFRLAAELSRPTMYLVGDEAMTTADLIGKQSRFQHRKVVDRFIHSVLKYEENVEQQWSDAKLTVACREGYTLIYDEFTRSRPEANNVLLAVLEERLLALPASNGAGEYVKVHPKFRIIFTSNPREYAGIHNSQDALNDRLVTLDMDYVDEASEVAITAARAKLSSELAAPIVRLVRAYRESGEFEQIPTPRATIMIAKMVSTLKLKPSASSSEFVQLCLDVLEGKCMHSGHSENKVPQYREALMKLLHEQCGGRRQINGSKTRAASNGRAIGNRAVCASAG